ncbi:MAG TPA: VOC family protein [Polyangiaceae bacterium]|nr:VOC family protein [Polyangiaceae bacterium]
MPDINTFISYDRHTEEAVRLYLDVFENGKVLSTSHGPDGKVFSMTFELFGKTFMAMNGGPSFTFAQGISLFVSCETQAQIDRYWSRLIADGGREVQCGWLVDKFGVSWQIIPKVLGSLLGGSDREKAGRALAAMMKMQKLDIAELQRAYDGA